MNGREPNRADRAAVEFLCVGDVVQAVPNGPAGTDANRLGWTLVQYPKSRWGEGSVLPYKHGYDRLFLLSRPGEGENR